MPAKQGDKVKVEYTGTLEDGTVFDSTENHGGQPLEFTIGGGQIIKGFEEAVIGMEKGDEKDIKLQPSDAYGDVNPQLVQKVPKANIPIEQEIKPGMMLMMGLPNGAQLPVRVKEVSDEEVTLDINHPLAGKVLSFRIKVVDFESS